MPFIVQDLITGRLKPITVQTNEPAQRALELMIENNFSQLPVVDPNHKPVGLVTSDSILRGVANLHIPLEDLTVAHVVEKVDQYYKADFPIFDLLKGLNVYPAVLIVDRDGALIGIVTNWDTADYFRRRAIDTMLLEDVEDLLRDHIRSAYSDEQSNKVDEILLRAAINEITNTSEQRLKDIKGSLKKYINLAEISHTPQETLIEDAFSKIIGRDNETKPLDDLTFYEYMELLLHKSVWPTYSAYLNIPSENLRKMLDEVRESRNAVAHFKREISEWERQRISYCIKFLQEIHPPFVTETQDVALSGDGSDEIIPLEDEPVVQDSMYAPLALHLQNQPRKVDRLPMTFDGIEEIIGTELPDSAREHRSWWANDSVSHVQSQQWLAAGWRVSSINMTEGVVTFVRSRERERAYIGFFGELLNGLRAKADFELSDTSPTGTHWLTVKAVPRDNRKLAWINYSFTREKKFRAELYIDTGEQDMNNHIFDTLYQQRLEIENEFGSQMSWERLDIRRASRIAVYKVGFITDDEADLITLRAWAVDAMISFEKAIAQRAEAAINKVVR